MTDEIEMTDDLRIEEVYQIVTFEIIHSKDPFFAEKVKLWVPDIEIEEVITDDLMQHLLDMDGYLIRNTSNGEIGLVEPATLSMKFEEMVSSDAFQGKRRSMVSRIIDKAQALSSDEDSEDYYRGMNDLLAVVAEIGEESA